MLWGWLNYYRIPPAAARRLSPPTQVPRPPALPPPPRPRRPPPPPPPAPPAPPGAPRGPPGDRPTGPGSMTSAAPRRDHPALSRPEKNGIRRFYPVHCFARNCPTCVPLPGAGNGPPGGRFSPAWGIAEDGGVGDSRG